MSGNKTNSNSITVILIQKLNDKKSGFRAAMLEKWELPNNTVFKDGTHSTIDFLEMENKEVDIVGMVGSNYKILIEIKANLNEDLQDSQKEDGQYVKTVKTNTGIKLKYIIPDGYHHSSELPKETDNIKIVKWSDIYKIAKETDNTGFTDQIDYFVQTDFSTNDILLNKGEVAMFLKPAEVRNVISLEAKIEVLIQEYVKEKKYQLEKKELWGYWIVANENRIWIGFYNLTDASDYYFFLYDDNLKNVKNNDNYKKDKDYWLYNNEIYIPILDKNDQIPTFLFDEKAEDQQKHFNELLDSNIQKFFEIVE